MKIAPFITVEGPDGAGKSSHLPIIIEELNKAGWKVERTREPGGTIMCEKIRNLILFPEKSEPLTRTTEVMMAFAARSQHYSLVIEPALEQGIAIMCDRFTDSTYAYQGRGQGVDIDVLKQLEEISIGSAKPDLTILFDVPVEVSRKRMGIRGNEADTFESKEDDFLQRVRDGYFERVSEDPNRFKVIDSTMSLQEVSDAVRKTVREFIEGYEPPRKKKGFRP